MSTARKRPIESQDPLVVVHQSATQSGSPESQGTTSDPRNGDKKAKKAEKWYGRIRSLGGYLCVVFGLLIVFWVSWNMVWRLPRALGNSADERVFAEGRAWAHLERLQSIGPSLVGTKSNVAVAAYIEGALKDLQAQLLALTASGHLKHAPMLEIEVQRPSGALNFDLLGYTLTNHYTRLHNVVARLSWGGRTGNATDAQGQPTTTDVNGPKALLVNSHFDSGVGSPGAMDARACNALMLELTRALSFAENPLHHPVIFLWNGAEESLQEGSHGFITQHRWNTTIGSVFNFDAGGIGGPQILFQVGSGEYAELFAKVAPRLHGSILAQELFDTGLLQGDTDYRIFRDFGDIHGLDLAWYRDGYKYHTPRDDLNWVEEGSLQHAGDNGFAYISAICSKTVKGSVWRDDHLKATQSKGEKSEKPKMSDRNGIPDLLDAYPSRSQIIFYDFLGLFPFHYSKDTATILNLSVAAVVLLLLFTLPSRQGHVSIYTILSAGTSVFGANVAGIIMVFLIAGWLTLTGKVLSWFANQYVVAIVYIPPIMVGWLLTYYWTTGKGVLELFKFSNKSSSAHQGRSSRIAKPWQQLEYEKVIGVAAWSTLTLSLWSILGIGSAYYWLWLSLSSLASLLVLRFGGLSPIEALKTNQSMVPLLSYLCFVPTILLCFQGIIQILAMVFPLSGRLPPDVPVEFVTGTIFALLFSITATPLQPLIHRFRHYKTIFKVALVMVVVGIVIASTTFPFSPYRPKRVTVQHAYRTAPFPGHPGLDEPAILFAVCDAGTMGSIISNLKEIDTRGASPHRDLHDWDAVFPLSTLIFGYSLPASTPPLRAPTATVITDQWDPVKQERLLVLQVDYTGAEWSTLKFLGPLKKWNLTSDIPVVSMPADGYHIIRHIGEHKLSTWAVELTFGDQRKRRFDLTATHFAPTPGTQTVTQNLPDWTALLAFTTAMSHIEI